MSHGQKKRGSHLADWKKKESKKTGEELNKALDRFECGKPIRIPKGSKLTRLNLAAEAGLSRDTPFSRYRKGHPKAGEFRFPQAVARFNRLRAKSRSKSKGKIAADEIALLKTTVAELEGSLTASRWVVNAQDVEIDRLKRRCDELEELVASLGGECDNLRGELVKVRRQSIKGVTEAAHDR
jgi:hypothetical protein